MSSINVLKVLLRKYEKDMCITWTATKNPSYTRVSKRRHPAWGKTVPRRFLPHIFPGLIISAYFVAYSVEYHIYRNTSVEGRW